MKNTPCTMSFEDLELLILSILSGDEEDDWETF